MRIHYLQHVPFEDAANVAVWARERGHAVARTLLYAGERLPDLASFDWLVIMGGPMNVYEEDRYPFLAGEKRFLRAALKAGKPTLGICLGAQLMADALGGRVTRNEHREIGWFPVSLTAAGAASPLFSGFPSSFEAFHWHGDTFSLPPGAIHLARSEACENQAFQWGDRALGLQFHLDYSRDAIAAMVGSCADELVAGPFVERDPAKLCDPARAEATKELLYRLLDAACTRG
jgi:GMP synthase-like glutamine amidotransferase